MFSKIINEHLALIIQVIIENNVLHNYFFDKLYSLSKNY